MNRFILGRRNMGHLFAALAICIAACPPAPSPVGKDASVGDAAPCDPAGISQARIIRDPATGKSLVVPCEAGR
jgi:hypothetical protein